MIYVMCSGVDIESIMAIKLLSAYGGCLADRRR